VSPRRRSNTVKKASGCRLHVFGVLYDFYCFFKHVLSIIEGSLEVKLPTIWRDEKQSRAEAERRGRLEERRSAEKE
jgi:hypothetical protein